MQMDVEAPKAYCSACNRMCIALKHAEACRSTCNSKVCQLRLTFIIQDGAPVVHVLLVVPVNGVVVIQVILDSGQIDSIEGAVAGILGDGEGVAMVGVTVVAVHAAGTVLCRGGCWGG